MDPDALRAEGTAVLPAAQRPFPWFAQSADEVVASVGTNSVTGLDSTVAAARLDQEGPNSLPTTPRPSIGSLIARQWRDPMTVLLTVLIAVSALVGQPETALLVALLVFLNVAMGARQEYKAQSSADALASMAVPSARVRRDGVLTDVPAVDLVSGDLIVVEAGDLVPADARITSAANLQVIESSLTGESATIDKDTQAVADPEAPLGDRTCMLYANTSVTRGAGAAVVVATGESTEMGRIASMLNSVEAEPSPLQKELRDLTIRLASVCLIAVSFIIAIGLARGLDANAIALVAIATAISSIPSGLPTFLTAMLSYGAQRLATAKAIVRTLNDVETLGSVSAINSDKTGTLTMDMMTAVQMFSDGQWFTIEGEGYSPQGAILHAAGSSLPDFTALGYGLTLCSDARLEANGTVVGDPTELALVVLAAKMGVDADISRQEYPRVALVPFDSAYKFMATFHIAPLEDDAPDSLIGLVKGAPDVVLARCSSALWRGEIVPIGEVADQIQQANSDLARRGLRVMSFAYVDRPVADADVVAADPMAAVENLIFVSLVGIIDPLRPSAVEAVATARRAGIEVRMITGDHAVTASAIAADLGLEPGVATGAEIDKMSDQALMDALPELHVFGRVSPQDKLRLVTLMQRDGSIVAMTGDAVNDAAALKKADIGVAMGSGAEVTKQAANMILTDNNFGTLVTAVELGRDIYSKITAQIRYVLVGLFGVLGLMLLASAFNVNSGNALTAVQLIFVTFLTGLFPALAISTDAVEPGTMTSPPRDPAVPILNRTTLPRWLVFGLVQAVVGLVAFAIADRNNWGVEVGQTMTFAVMGVSTVLFAAALRRDLTPGWFGPYPVYFGWLAVPMLLTWLAVDWDGLQPLLGTVALNGSQWAIAIGLSLIPAAVIEAEKALRRARPASYS